MSDAQQIRHKATNLPGWRPRGAAKLGLLLLLASGATAAPVYTPLLSLGNDVECEKCQGYLLPGAVVPREDYRYAIHSDLPEIFKTDGVLYATFPVLPPFDTAKDGPLAEEMRTQVNHGFTAIDDSFEVFLYHMSELENKSHPRRLVVLAMNKATEPVQLSPLVAIEAKGKMGTNDGPETRLARRVFTGDFETRDSVTIEPGKAGVLAVSPIVAAAQDGPDSTTSSFVNGIVRGIVESPGKTALDVAVVAIPADTPIGEYGAAAERLLSIGAKSGETAMDLRIAPPDCHLRRVVGVYRNFNWKGGAVIDVTALPGDNLAFQMALPAAQAKGCEAGRQTQDMLLHPPYVRPETIGNYTIEYHVDLDLHNPSTETVPVDVRFGKPDASVGLVWTAAVGEVGAVAEPGPVRSGWAGAWAKGDLPDDTLSFLESPLLLTAGESRRVRLHFHVVGTSSLPFQLHVIREKATPVQ
ncbi:DUF3370 family protein [bacterium]|nr:DUF3370 family protein [bacterium]